MRAKLLLLFCFIIATALPGFARIKGSIPDAARLQILLNKLTLVGNALYVGAHPDDENTAVLSYLSLGRMLRTGYLALNRGEGGQNLIGTEQGDALGVIRTQELLAARQIDFAQQFFTRAVDFGFSKSPEESLKLWGKEDVLSDVVWVYRRFRPDVVITRFPSQGETHGHHVASSILAEEAFTAAADPKRYPEQLKYVSVWKPKRVVWNRYSWGNQPITEEEKATLAVMEIGEYNSLLGKSYTEIAGISRSMHKSQGFGDSEDRGRFTNYFRHTAGDPAKKDLLEGIDLSWNRIPGGSATGALLTEAAKSFDPSKPEKSVPQLLKAYAAMQKIPNNPWVEEKKQDLLQAIQGCSGLWLEAIAQTETSTPGSAVMINAAAINRSSFPLQLTSIAILSSNAADEASALRESVQANLTYNEPVSKSFSVQLREQIPYSQLYWLRERNSKPFAAVKDQMLIGQPESPATLQARFTVKAGDQVLEFTEPVFFRKVDPVKGEVYRDFVIEPELSVDVHDNVLIFADQTPRSVRVFINAVKAPLAGQLKLAMPAGWSSEPSVHSFQLQQSSPSGLFTFQVRPENGAQNGSFTAQANVNGKAFTSKKTVVDYPHIPAQTMFTPATGKLVRLDLKRAGEKIAYVAGSGDAIPEALKQVGYQITLLNEQALMTQNLSDWDTIVVGIRAYNARPELKNAHQRLLEYVKTGGTLVVQYQTMNDLNVSGGLGPFPFQISRKRVSVENAPVSILKPDHPLLNYPNKISASDFEGWVQERGLYFADPFDPQYETILASNDPGESALPGGILYARYGNGVYIFTSYSWFRQLPAGVPGAFRIFVNLISAGKQK